MSRTRIPTFSMPRPLTFSMSIDTERRGRFDRVVRAVEDAWRGHERRVEDHEVRGASYHIAPYASPERSVGYSGPAR